MVEIPGYVIQGLLGRGGMGEVYRAEHVQLARPVALKVIRPDQANPRLLARFLREAKVLARIRHPHLVGLIDCGDTRDGLVWLALELCRGQALDRVLKDRTRLPEPEVERLMRGVGGALAALHAEGVLHRDLKPANIMLEPDGRAVLMDLGLATGAEMETLTATGHVVGTPAYIAPEILQGQAWDPSFDWFAWAITGWELVTGARPFEFNDMVAAATTRRDLRLPPPPPGAPAPSRRWQAVVERCIGPSAARPQTFAEVEELLAQATVPARSDDRSTVELPRPAGPGAKPSDGPGGRGSTIAPLARPGPVPPGRAPGWGRGFVLGTLATALLALAWTGRPRPPPEPVPPPPEAPAEPAPRAHALPLGALVLAQPPDPDRVRAWRVDRGRREPVPVFALADGTVALWAAGMDPGTTAVLELDGVGPGPGRVAVRAGGPGEALPDDLPEVLAPLFRRPGARARDWLELVRARAGTGRPIPEESALMDDLPVLRKLEPEVWPQVLAWLERDQVFVTNVVRALRFASADPPPAVTWSLIHRHADPGAPLTRLEAGDPGLDLPVLAARRPPLLALDRIEEWCRDPAAPRETLLRLAVRMARGLAGGPGWKPFPCMVPSWLPASGEADPFMPEPGSLAQRCLDGAAGAREKRAPPALVEAARQPGPAGLRAAVGVGLSGDMAQVPWLLERLRTAPAEDLPWLDAALEGLRTKPGFFNAVDGPCLFRVGFRDYPILRIEGHTGLVAVFRNELRAFYHLAPPTGIALEVVGADGRRVRFEGNLSDGHTRVPLPGRGG